MSSFLYNLTAPGAPRIVAEECSAENNSITVAWQAHPASFVEGFILELDDGGTTGRFRVIYLRPDVIIDSFFSRFISSKGGVLR